MTYRAAASKLPLCFFLVFSAVAAGCRQEPQAPKAGTSTIRSATVATTTPLAILADNEKPHLASPAAGHMKAAAPQGQTPVFHIEWNENGSGVAYIAKVGDKVRVVHNGKKGKLYSAIDDYTLAVSPDGTRVAYGANRGESRFMVVDGKEEGPFANVGPPVFSPDSKHIAYEAQKGEKWHIIVDNDILSPACSSYYEKPFFSADSTRIAYVENADEHKKMRLVVSDLNFKKQTIKEYSFVYVMTDPEKTRFAGTIRTDDNRYRVIVLSLYRPDVVTEGPWYDEVHNLAFSNDGTSYTYIAHSGEALFMVLNGKTERLPEGKPAGPSVVRPDNMGAAVFMFNKDGSFLHQGFIADGTKEKPYEEVADLVYSKDGSVHAYAARKGNGWFIVVNGKEGPVFDRVVTPQFSPDKSRLVYRAREGDKRFVVVADAAGTVVRRHANYERIFPPVFTADGKSVAYGVKDGKKLIWMVEKL